MASTGKLTQFNLLIICMLIMMMMTTAPRSEAAISCSMVISSVYPCYDYVTKGGDAPLAACCSGIKSLYIAAKTKGDRQSVCTCLKSLAAGFTGIKFDSVASLPEKCGVHVPYKISPNMECSKVPME